MWEIHDGWGWWMVFGWVWMLVIWGLIVWGIYALVTYPERRRESGQTAEREPLKVLEARFARGDITADQFQEMRKLIERNLPPSAARG